MSDEDKKISQITGLERFEQGNFFDNLNSLNTLDMDYLEEKNAKEQGISLEEYKKNGGVTPESQMKETDFIINSLENYYLDAQEKIPLNITNDPYLKNQEYYSNLEKIVANWHLSIGGQFVQDLYLLNDIGIPDRNAQYDEDGNVFNPYKHPVGVDLVKRGHGQKLIDERVVNPQHLLYLNADITKNEEHYKRAAESNLLQMFIGGAFALENFMGFFLVKPGLAVANGLGKTFSGFTKGKKVQKVLNLKIPLVGSTVGQTSKGFVSAGTNTSLTALALEPLRWELDPLGSAAQTPGILLGTFLVGGTFHSVVMPTLKNGAKSAFNKNYRDRHFAPEGGEQAMQQKYIGQEYIKKNNNEDWDNFEYEIGDDFVGIRTVEYADTNTFLIKENGGILITKKVDLPDNEKPILYENRNNESYPAEYMPIVIKEVSGKGNQPRLEIIKDEFNLEYSFNQGFWKDIVPEPMHPLIKNADDLGKWHLKKEFYRTVKYPKKTNETPFQHMERINTLMDEDFKLRQTDDIRTDYGKLPLLSDYTKAINSFTDIEIGTRSFEGNRNLQYRIGKSFSRLLADNRVPTKSQISAETNSIFLKKRAIYEPLDNKFMDDFANDYNQYYNDNYKAEYRDRFPLARADTQKHINQALEFEKRNIKIEERVKKLSDLITNKQKENDFEITRDKKLYKTEYEDAIFRAVIDDEKFNALDNQGMINSVNRVRRYLDKFKQDIEDIGMLDNLVNSEKIQRGFNEIIDFQTKILADHNNGVNKLEPKVLKYITKARNDLIRERNSMGLKDPIDLKEAKIKDAENLNKKYELTKEYMPRRYVVDNIVSKNTIWETKVLYPFYMANELKINVIGANGRQMKGFLVEELVQKKLDTFPVEKQKKLINKIMKEARKTSLTIIDVNSVVPDIEGGFAGYHPDLINISNRNKISPLQARGVQIATHNMIDIPYGSKGKTVTFVSTEVTSSLRNYNNRVSTAIEMHQRFGDKNGRLEYHRIQKDIIKEMLKMKKVSSKFITESNKVLSSWENGVNKQYGTYQTLDPRSVTTKLANIAKDILTPAKLANVVYSSLVDYAQHHQVHSFASYLKSSGALKSLEKTLSPDELRVMKKESQYIIGIIERFANNQSIDRFVTTDNLTGVSKTNLAPQNSSAAQRGLAKLKNFGESSLSKTESAMQDYNRYFFQIFGLPQWTAYQKELAKDVVSQNIFSYMVKLGKNRIDKSFDDVPFMEQYLRDIGISKTDIESAMRLYDAGLFNETAVDPKSFLLKFTSLERLAKIENETGRTDGKVTNVYYPAIHKFATSGIPNAANLSMKIRFAIAAGVDKTILVPNHNTEGLFYGDAFHLYSDKSRNIAASPFFKPAGVATAAALGMATGGPVGSAIGAGLALTTKVTVRKDQVILSHVIAKLFGQFLAWTRTASRVRLTNVFANRDANIGGGMLFTTLLASLGLWIKQPEAVMRMMEDDDWEEIALQSFIAGGSLSSGADIFNAIDMATDYQYGIRGLLDMPNPYGIDRFDTNYSRNFGALASTLIEGHQIFNYGTDEDKADWLTRSVLPANNFKIPRIPYNVGRNVYYPEDKGGSAIGETFRENLIMPFVEDWRL